jgi:hypothetical protein
MDTTTKMIALGITDEMEFGKTVFILSSILTGNVTKKTQKLAKSLEFTFSNYWEQNQWLRMFASGKTIDDSWLEEIRKEIKKELKEK